MEEHKEGIKLSLDEFDVLNGCDQLALFSLETDRFLATLEDEEILDFDYFGHYCNLIDQLYRKFEYVIVTPQDEFIGYRDSTYKVLYKSEGSFAKAKEMR